MKFSFIFLVVLATILLWFLLAFLFKPIGKLLFHLIKDVEEAMEINNNNNKEKESEEK